MLTDSFILLLIDRWKDANISFSVKLQAFKYLKPPSDPIMLACIFLLLSLNALTSSAMFSHVVRVKLLPKRSPLALARTAPQSQYHTSTDGFIKSELMLLRAMGQAHELYLSGREKQSHRQASFLIASSAAIDPVFSEVLNLMTNTPFYKQQQFPAEFDLDFQKPDTLQEAMTVNDDSQGKFLLVRKGLLEIRLTNDKVGNAEDTIISITRPTRAMNSMLILNPLADLLLAKLSMAEITPISALAHTFKSTVMYMHKQSEANSDNAMVLSDPFEGYKNYGLILQSPKIDNARISLARYCMAAGLDQIECESLKDILANL